MVALRHEDFTPRPHLVAVVPPSPAPHVALVARRVRTTPRRPVAWDARPRISPVVEEATPKPRRNMLPENTDYPDTGCDISRSCLRCPLARCQYDIPGSGTATLRAEVRDREIVLLRRKHRVPIKLLAATYGVSRRTVFRILRAHGIDEGPRRSSLPLGARGRGPLTRPRSMQT